MDDRILVDACPSYRVLTLNRPDRMNALDDGTIHALLAALDAAEADASCRALLLTATGRAFCAGADLSSIKPPADLGDVVERSWNPLARKLHTLRMPTVCAVNGVAAGAGANVALACDIVLASRSASFIQSFARIGLVPDAGGSYVLPRLVGIARASALAMLGDKLSATQAAEWGLIWRVVEDAALMGEATALARHLAQQPTRALALIKQALNASPGNTLDQQLDLERDLQKEAAATEDFREGMAAFLEKRSAKFVGR
jgi:2-(1,2-epoxy-1,2-dihydrophenyl)acetyl-CoA isomerase